MSQKKRAKKTSKGLNGGGGKVDLTPLQKILLGGGQFRSFAPIGSRNQK